MSIVHIYLMKYAFTATISSACTLLGLIIIIVVCFEFYVDEGIRVLIHLYVYVM